MPRAGTGAAASSARRRTAARSASSAANCSASTRCRSNSSDRTLAAAGTGAKGGGGAAAAGSSPEIFRSISRACSSKSRIIRRIGSNGSAAGASGAGGAPGAASRATGASGAAAGAAGAAPPRRSAIRRRISAWISCTLRSSSRASGLDVDGGGAARRACSRPRRICTRKTTTKMTSPMRSSSQSSKLAFTGRRRGSRDYFLPSGCAMEDRICVSACTFSIL
ncbi:MAG: hypothetical protein FJ397_01145 [Verrucomicrobia bacterium]|nr:hypothetical protein [Verrucomicrobiota bacterium]